MKTIEIEGKELILFEGGEDGKIGVQFDSETFSLEKFPYQSNGLKKETKITKIVLDLEQNKILTEKKTYSITPIGKQVDTTINPIFETKQSDVDLFMKQVTPLLVPAGLNGIVRDMGLTRAIMNLNGTLIESQPIPIPEEE